MPNPENRPQLPSPEWQPWMERSSSLLSVAIYLSDKEGRLLMVQDIDEHGGKWSPIAGYIDDLLGEEPEIAAIREAKEELGLDVLLDGFLGVWNYYENGTPDNKHKVHVGYAYTGKILDGTFEMQKEEIQNWGYFSPEQIEELHANGKLKTPEYNYRGFKLWQAGTKHPLEVVQTNRRSLNFPTK